MRVTPLLLAILLAAPNARAGQPDAIDRAIQAAKPAVIEVPGKKRSGCLILLGLPGRRTTSESFAQFLARGLEGKLEEPATILSLQDPATGGPPRQGVAIGTRKNRWRLDAPTLPALTRFTRSASHGCRRLAVVGYSSGGWSAPAVALRLADRLDGVSLVAVVLISAGTRVEARPLAKLGAHVLFLTAAARRPEDRGRVVASDSATRAAVLRDSRRLAAGGVQVVVREVESARRHPQWHWGIISPCRHFEPPARPTSERSFGSYPAYGQPSLELFAFLAPFLEGRPPPERFSGPAQPCSE